MSNEDEGSPKPTRRIHCGNQHPERPGVCCGKLLNEDERHSGEDHHRDGVSWSGSSPWDYNGPC